MAGKIIHRVVSFNIGSGHADECETLREMLDKLGVSKWTLRAALPAAGKPGNFVFVLTKGVKPGRGDE